MSQEIKERPILFSGPMIRALLAGTKTQTRRVVKPTSGPHNIEQVISTPDSLAAFVRHRCPYGKTGDRMWVREAWKVSAHQHGYDNGTQESGSIDFEEGVAVVQYRSDGALKTFDDLDAADDEQASRAIAKWRPSIHMPRWASRILLEIVSVRVERLQDISDEDAVAEGMPIDDAWYDYMRLWERLNGASSWAANPWVWVVEFKRITPCP